MSRGWLQLLPNRGYDPPLGCPAPTSEKTLLLSTRVNKGGGCSSTASPTSYPRYFSATRTPYTLVGRYDAQADSLLPRTPRYLPEDPDGCWAWKDLAVCSERAMPDHPMKGGHHGLEARSGPHPGLRCGPGEALLQRAGRLRRRSRHPDRRRDAPRPADSARLGLLDPPERRDPEHAAGSARGLAARRLRHRGCPGRTVRAGREGWPGCT